MKHTHSTFVHLFNPTGTTPTASHEAARSRPGCKPIRSSAVKSLLLMLLAALAPGFLLSACAQSPLKAGDAADIVAEIKAAQKKHVRESSGTESFECFTDLDYREFKAGKVPQKVAAAMRSNRKFMEGLLALQAKPEAERATFIKSCRKPLRPTWAELGRISPEGQTDAGNAAELDIANAIADLIEELVKLPEEKLQDIFQKR